MAQKALEKYLREGLWLCTTKVLENFVISPNGHLLVLQTPNHVGRRKARVDGRVLHKPPDGSLDSMLLNTDENYVACAFTG